MRTLLKQREKYKVSVKKLNGNIRIEKDSDQTKNIIEWDPKNRDNRKRINGHEDMSIENFQSEQRKNIFGKMNRASEFCRLTTLTQHSCHQSPRRRGGWCRKKYLKM